MGVRNDTHTHNSAPQKQENVHTRELNVDHTQLSATETRKCSHKRAQCRHFFLTSEAHSCLSFCHSSCAPLFSWKKIKYKELGPKHSMVSSRSLFGVRYVPLWLVSLLLLIPQAAVLLYSLNNAYRIRTHALTEYGMVIHEFDPWFNYRATQYLSKNGWQRKKVTKLMYSWYPLGRPVGTTIYPGLQLTSVAIHRVLRWLGPAYRMTLNDICCTLPCWGGAAATLLVALLTYETTGSRSAAVISAGV
ncbi:oligosaccharyl transferase-like protein, putative, partial [Bodo saltans]